MASARLLLVAEVLVLQLLCSDAYNVLVMPLLACHSPAADVMAVAGELAARNHTVTAVIMHSDIKKAQSNAGNNSHLLSYITFQSPWHDTPCEVVMLQATGGQPMHSAKISKILKAFVGMYSDQCKALMDDATTLQAIRDLKADAVLSYNMQSFTGETCACVVAHMLGVPLLATEGLPLMEAPLSVPQIMSGLTPAEVRTPLGFARNVFAWALLATLRRVAALGSTPWASMRAAHGVPPASACGGCAPLVDVRQVSFHLEWPRPLPPDVVLVGPTSARFPAPLEPLEVAAFADAADPANGGSGLVLAAFGSTLVMGGSLTTADYEALATAFAALAPVRVLWALKAASLRNGTVLSSLPLGSNTMIVPWVAMNDVLGHPAAAAFVSHGGVHSVYEAAFHGAPMLCMPFQKEQADNCRRMEFKGLGVISKEAAVFRTGRQENMTFTSATLERQLKQVITDTGIRRAAQQMGAALQLYAKHRHPLQRAADALEDVLVMEAGKHS